MSVVPIRDAADGMTEDFDRRLGDVLVVVGCASLSKVLEQPGLVLTCLGVFLRCNSCETAELSEPSIWTRSAATMPKRPGAN